MTVGILASPAQAANYSWTSSLTDVGPGFESRRWYDDNGYTTITFTDCYSGGHKGAEVRVRKDVVGPDPAYAKALFTNCFNGYSATSTGNWSPTGVTSGNFYFAVNEAATTLKLSVRTLTVSYAY
ncbi:hypothetical protein AB0A99_02345 [Streptomyces fradiae]|uniref:hypothetical protein n=1 Tax=Streptomyces fradiae TaxID=1906 RepID=UPI0033DF2A6E